MCATNLLWHATRRPPAHPLATREAAQVWGAPAGDIGTSPLYVFSTTFAPNSESPRPSLGTTSLIIWALTWLLVLKYSFIVLRADDNGQGAMPAGPCAQPGMQAGVRGSSRR